MNEQFLMFRASPSFLEATADKPMPEFSASVGRSWKSTSYSTDT